MEPVTMKRMPQRTAVHRQRWQRWRVGKGKRERGKKEEGTKQSLPSPRGVPEQHSSSFQGNVNLSGGGRVLMPGIGGKARTPLQAQEALTHTNSTRKSLHRLQIDTQFNIVYQAARPLQPFNDWKNVHVKIQLASFDEANS